MLRPMSHLHVEFTDTALLAFRVAATRRRRSIRSATREAVLLWARQEGDVELVDALLRAYPHNKGAQLQGGLAPSLAVSEPEPATPPPITVDEILQQQDF